MAEERKKEGAGAPDVLTDRARELYNQGRKEFDASRWAEAHALFSAAWGLKKHWQIAANLGDCELELGRYAEAAEHYTYYMREVPADRKQKAKTLFEKVRAKVGEVKVQVDRAGADVLLDGVWVGKSPLGEPVFVMPGKHALQIRVGTQMVAEESVEAAAGGSYDIALPPKSNKATPTPAQPQAEQSRMDQPSAIQPSQPPPNDSKLPVRKIVIGAGIGTTAILLGTGTALAVVSNNKAADRRMRLEALEKVSGPSPCYVPSRNVSECAKVVTLRDDRDRSANVAFWSFIAGGVVGAGTLVYALIPPKRSEASAVQALVMPSPDGAGFMVHGQW